ncbi:RING-type domain-containing protein [Mycena kentingensis (nom. inval.)]|nr:RING-type domain-containing protein [Mycena kentingensis (nom. inval.)]
MADDAAPLHAASTQQHDDTLSARVQLKRSASAASLMGVLEETTSRKRIREDGEPGAAEPDAAGNTNAGGDELVEQLTQELQCGACCSLVYKPVLVQPCQHFFCGSCCVLWIRNGGTNCPACRGISTSVVPFRPLQTIIDVLLRAAPDRARTQRERDQADEIYTGTSMRLPAPRDVSPEPDINPSDYARPCPNCLPNNAYGWVCPQPIVDFNIDPERAWSLEDGSPPGHGLCGNCENLLALASPITSKCDFCQVSFCGITAAGRCQARAIALQELHEMQDLGDLVQSTSLYELFSSNNVEVDIMLDYLTSQQISPRHIYREIVAHIQTQPRGFLPLIELELFVDMHGSPAAVDPNPQAPRNKICRHCAAEVFMHGLRDWFIRERAKGFLEPALLNKKDCIDGAECGRQQDIEHAREFNHMVPFKSTQANVPPPPPILQEDVPDENDDDDDDDEEEANVILNAEEADLSFEMDLLPSAGLPPAPTGDQEMPDAV